MNIARKRINVLLGIVVATSVMTSAQPVLADVTLLFSDYSGNNHANNILTIGTEFTVGPNARLVVSLGAYCAANGPCILSTTHQVGIWRFSDQVLVGSATVPSGAVGTLIEDWRFIDLATPFTLEANTTYRIGGFTTGDSDPNGGVFTANPTIGVTAGSVANSGGFSFPFRTLTNARVFANARITDVVSDSDGDGVPDDQDVCEGGDDNLDTDGDSVPDFCDPCPNDVNNDADGDGVCGDVDVCSGGDDNIDFDIDGVPDFCDVCPVDFLNDADGDGFCESEDNCPIIANSDQSDLDLDGQGDACDADTDGDGVLNDADNCVFDVNPDQADFDGDDTGDVCDTDVDGDGVPNIVDACPMTLTGEVVEAGGCSVNDLCPCDNDWKNHGAYVRCVAHTSEDFVEDGLITEVEKDTIVSIAGMSSCGKKK